MKINLSGREIDVSGVLPLKIKHWRELTSKYGITPQNMQEPSVDQLATMLFFILNLADPTVTMEDVDNLTLPQLLELAGSLHKKEEVTDRPT